MKDRFIEFLAENKAYRQFMHNLAYVERGAFSWDDYAYEVPAEDWVCDAFFWDQGKESFKFWLALHEKWQKIIK